MNVRMSGPMLDALRHTPEIPDNLLACVEKAHPDGDAFQVPLNQDEAMAMEEMCQWYIRRDPRTGKMDDKTSLFDAIVKAIYHAEDQ